MLSGKKPKTEKNPEKYPQSLAYWKNASHNKLLTLRPARGPTRSEGSPRMGKKNHDD